jgi:hypothetical protein
MAMRDQLASVVEVLSDPPRELDAEAGKAGFAVLNPYRDRPDVPLGFVETYASRLTPAGVLVVGAAPDAGGSARTGVPFTDERHAHDILGLPTSGRASEETATRFWGLLGEARVFAGLAPIEALFSTVHLAHAIPYGVAPAADPTASVPVERAVLRMPSLERHGLAQLAETIQACRPTVTVALGEFPYRFVARLARNRLALERLVDEEGFQELALSRRWPEGPYPWAEFGGFRSRLVPLAHLRSPLFEHTRANLLHILAEAWTAG